MRFAEPRPLCYAVVIYRKCYIYNYVCNCVPDYVNDNDYFNDLSAFFSCDDFYNRKYANYAKYANKRFAQLVRNCLNLFIIKL